ncbi:MAG: energy-coupling factor transporter ATPase [Coriobacteriia bacterium]|nr:energy-coupling factor transporter ATPase [Coriobacteriia bacterium]
MIHFAHTRFSYDGTRFALEEVNLRVAPGEFVCVLGANGSGKSTLAKHVNALLIPGEGCVTVAGYDTRDAGAVYDVRSRVAMVFQNPEDALVATTVAEDVAFGPAQVGVPAAELAKRVAQSLRAVGLEGFEQRDVNTLSGGQQQRVALAGALAMAPEVLVLDEATALLDPAGRQAIMRVVRALHGQGMTVVWITHFMEEAVEADRVVILDAGAVACEGAPEQVLERRDQLHAWGLKPPPAVLLCEALRERGLDVRDCLRLEDVVRQLQGRVGAANETGDGGVPYLAADERAWETPSGSAPFAEEPLLELRDVSFCYGPDQPLALQGVSFHLRAGQVLGVAGPTGSGKSTLLGHLNGLLAPTQGTVLYRGEQASGAEAVLRLVDHVGLAFQYPERQLFASSVLADVAFGPRNRGLSKQEAFARARAALQQAGLDPARVEDCSPFALSGGQQRRVALAGVLALQPEVLVLDEPTAGMDPAAHDAFVTLIGTLRADGLTVVLASHNMDDLAVLCDTVLLLDQGRVAACGAPADVFAQASVLQRLGLEPPFACRAAQAIGLPGYFSTAEALADVLAQ